MARYVFKLPDVGEGTTEAEIVAWHVKPGDMVRAEDALVDVMTDKATVELPSPVAGTVVAINGAAGEKRAVGSDLVEFEVAGEGNTGATEEAPAPTRGPTPPRPPAPRPMEPPAPVSAASPSPPGRAAPPAVFHRPGDKPLASPAVRRRAWDLGVELQFVAGSGPAGRITQADLDAYSASRSDGAAALGGALSRREGVEEVPIIGLRRRIAERLQDSMRRIPHFSYVEEIDVTALEALRHDLNTAHEAERGRLTLLPFLIRAIVRAVPVHPQVNAHFDDAAGILRRYRPVHCGIATQTPDGLMVPVLHHAEALDPWQAAAELRRLAEAARAGKASRDELSGSTITITSLGRLGGIASTPVINPPEVAIVGVNKIAERPTVCDGRIAVRQMMNLSSSFDHRIVDGWDAAAFIQHVKQLLETPARLFID